MGALDFAARKLGGAQVRRRPLAGYEIDWAHPQMRGIVHWWDGFHQLEGIVGTIPDLVPKNSVPLPRYNRTAGDLTYNYSEGSVVSGIGDWDYLRTGTSYAGLGSTALTLSGWFKTNTDFQVAAERTYGVLRWGDSGDGQALTIIENDVDSQVEFYITVTSGSTKTEGISYVAIADADAYNQKWTHFVGVFHGAETPRIYLNGREQVIDASTTALATSSSSSEIWVAARDFAGLGGSHQGFPGELRDLRCYDRALTAGEVFGMYREPYAAVKPALPQILPIINLYPDLVCETAVFNTTGGDAGLYATSLLTCATTTYTTTGGDAIFAAVSVLTADVGAFTTTGGAAGLYVTSLLTADTAAYVTTGGAATFTYITAPLAALTTTALPSADGMSAVTQSDHTIIF